MTLPSTDIQEMSSSTGRARLSSLIIKCAVSPEKSRTPSSPSRGQETGAALNSEKTLYVAGFARRTKSTELHKHFSSVGKVKRCNLVRDRNTNEFLGYGFVTLETVEEAELCIKYLNGSILGGQFITVKKAKRSVSERERKRFRNKRQNRGYYSRDQQRSRSRSPYEKRKRMDNYSDSNKRRRVGRS